MFKQALISAHKKLDKLRDSGELKDFALIGAMALSLYVEPRSMANIDFAISPKSELDIVAKKLGGVARIGDIYDPLAGAVTFPVSIDKKSISIQCVRFHPAIEAICFEDIKATKLEKIQLRAVSPAALVLLKLYAGSALDLEDARKVLLTGILKGKELEYLKRKAQALRLTSRLNKML